MFDSQDACYYSSLTIDGKAFHKFTKGFKRPFDTILIKTMQETMKYLCENIQGCVLGYTQSDEITLVLQDYKTLTTDAWFDYEVQKLCSVSASMATMAFNRYFSENVEKYCNSIERTETDGLNAEQYEQWKIYRKALEKGAMFDARCFNIPKEEVTNCIYWRQQDASRNSILSVAQAYFSRAKLHGKNLNALQDMLMVQKNVNWNNYPTHQKRGSCCIQQSYLKNDIESTRWVIDNEIPIFKGDNRNYIERLIYFEAN